MRTTAETAAPSGSPPRLPETEAGFEGFFEAWNVPLYRALWLVARNRHEAEEIMQDAFLKVWERWGRVSAMDRPEAYLFRTAMNLYRSRLRRAVAAVRRTVGALPADDAMAVVEERDAIVRAMGSLTPAQRAAVVLTDLVGLSSGEAGEALGVRPVTVRVLAARGRAALKERMADGDDD
jgi:RNA polymerase sigma-70 factor (ECF subfamily)